MNLEAVNGFIGSDWAYPENDCWQVFRKAAAAVFGVQVHAVEVPPVPAPAENGALFGAEFTRSDWQRVDEPVPGCAVLFYGNNGTPIHIGLHVEGGNVLHCAVRTRYDELRLLRRVYHRIEFYSYAPDHRTT